MSGSLTLDVSSMEKYFNINACLGNRGCHVYRRFGFLHVVDATSNFYERYTSQYLNIYEQFIMLYMISSVCRYVLLNFSDFHTGKKKTH